MDTRTTQYLRKLFRNYYERNASRLRLPPDYTAREFAAQLWGMKSYIRHLAFSSREALEKWVVDKAPRHLYFSSAVYRLPSAPSMEEKGWLGADLTFDIDADHLTKCRDKIVEINDANLGIKTSITPDECVSEAAWEAVKLVDILRYELGFKKDNISVEFSGHRGFHVIVYCKGYEECFTSDSTIRKEIVDYIRAELLDELLLSLHAPIEDGKGRKRVRVYPVPPRTTDPGIKGRIARIMSMLAAKKGEQLVRRVVTAPPVEASRLYRSHADKIEEFIRAALEEVRIEIDTQVTLDTKRLIRIPYSLHGKSGLVVTPVDPQKLTDNVDLSRFSPFTKLGSIRIKPLVNIKGVKIFGYVLNLDAGNAYKLPAHIAIYLMAKEVAVLG